MEKRIENRVRAFRKQLEDSQLDALLVQIDANRRYLSGFTGEDTGFDESAGALLITGNDLILATDSRYTLQAENECPGYTVYTYKKGLSRELPDIARDLKIKRLGYENRRISCDQFRLMENHLREADSRIEMIATADLVEKLRIIKDADEIETIRRAVALAEAAFADVWRTLRPGVTEIEAAWALERRMRESGAEAVSFPVIVAAGTNAALPHAIPGHRPIQEGEPILFDWGARLDGYCSDTSRTVILGKPDATFQIVFTAVYDAQQKAIEMVRPGGFTRDIDAAARNILKDKGLDTFFGHGLGHGVGLAIHEQPSLSPMMEKNVPLEEGMVFTVEPGVYLPDWGGVRLENMVVVRRDGPEVLHTLPVRL